MPCCISLTRARTPPGRSSIGLLPPRFHGRSPAASGRTARALLLKAGFTVLGRIRARRSSARLRPGRGGESSREHQCLPVPHPSIQVLVEQLRASLEGNPVRPVVQIDVIRVLDKHKLLRLFASEAVAFSRAMRRLGRFVVLRERVTSSGRKVRQYTFRKVLETILRQVIKGPRRAWRSREGLDVWYNAPREPPE